MIGGARGGKSSVLRNWGKGAPGRLRLTPVRRPRASRSPSGLSRPRAEGGLVGGIARSKASHQCHRHGIKDPEASAGSDPSYPVGPAPLQRYAESSGFSIFSGTLLGICACLLWCAQGATMVSYPDKDSKGICISRDHSHLRTRLCLPTRRPRKRTEI